MGASSSVAIFEAFSTSIQWILQNKLGVLSVSHIIDDFIFVGKAGSQNCSKYLASFFALAESIHLPVNASKTVQPTTVAEIHGIQVDTNTLTARLPPDKIDTLRTLLDKHRRCKKITLHELQSLLGHLNFACKVIKPGCCFLRRLYDLTIGSVQTSSQNTAHI